jgi:hypothetical protein
MAGPAHTGPTRSAGLEICGKTTRRPSQRKQEDQGDELSFSERQPKRAKPLFRLFRLVVVNPLPQVGSPLDYLSVTLLCNTINSRVGSFPCSFSQGNFLADF